MDLLHIPPAQPASHEHPACTHSRSDSFIDILDCGNAAGRAAMALAGGQKHIILSPRCPQTAGIRILATSLGALVLPTPPEAIVVAPGTTPAVLAAVLTAFLPSAFLSPQREKNGQQRPDGA